MQVGSPLSENGERQRGRRKVLWDTFPSPGPSVPWRCPHPHAPSVATRPLGLPGQETPERFLASGQVEALRALKFISKTDFQP